MIVRNWAAYAKGAPYALAVFACAPQALAQTPQPPQAPESDESVVVVAQRPFGSVSGDAIPQIVLSPADILSYGASNLDELIQSLAPETASARGRGEGGAVILLNGRRIAGFNEIGPIPTEAIMRVEIFTEDVALQYGYSADQRVVNIVLLPFFRSLNSELDAGAASQGVGENSQGGLGYLALTPRGRVIVDGRIQSQNAFNELQSGVTAPLFGADERSLRTQAPDSDNLNLTGVWNHVFNRDIAETSSLTLMHETSESHVGLDPATSDLVKSQNQAESANASFTLDGSSTSWSWTATARAQQRRSTTTVEASDPSRSESTNTNFEAIANINGVLARLPAGSLRLSARGSFNEAELDGSSLHNGVTTQSNLDRSDLGARFTLSAPIAKRSRHVLEGLGDVSVNLTGSIDALSDFDTAWSIGGGVNWSPVSDVRLSLQFDHANSAPSLEQLGAPQLTTPGTIVFDATTGQTVLVSVTSGGNPDLNAEVRSDFTFNASYAPHQFQGLSFTGSFVHNETDNALTAFPLFTTALEDAFPARFTRDAGGTLIAIDRTPINLARRETETARVGMTFTRGFGPRIGPPRGAMAPFGGVPRAGDGFPPPPEGAPDGPPPPEAATPTQSGPMPDAPPSWAPPPGGPPGGGGPGFGGGGFGGRGGGFGGFGGGGPPQAGRFNFSIFYARRLEDTVVFVTGRPALDLLDGAALGGDADGGIDKIEFEGGLSWRGLGVRLSGAWNSGYTIAGATQTEDITYGDVATIDMRAFFDFSAHPEWVRAHPFFRGARLVLRVDNLFEAEPSVHDASGATPYADQPARLNPYGRQWQIGLRKLF
jgi:hypothetical protein